MSQLLPTLAQITLTVNFLSDSFTDLLSFEVSQPGKITMLLSVCKAIAILSVTPITLKIELKG